jgi:D-serine deaminase-like pyridoxal phosphate-dependent protein
VVSVGSTPAALTAETLEGVTELRAGVYMFQDLVMAGIGVCAIDDIAVSVLATVIAHNRAQKRVIIDAGGLALSKDRGTADQPVDQGFGLVADARTGTVLPGLIVQKASQEHGMVTARSGDIPFELLPIGSRVRVLPNHVCMTAAAHDDYHVIASTGEVKAIWARCRGW